MCSNNCFSSYVLPLLDKKEKFLLFAHHQVLLNAVEDLVKRKNVKYIRIDGNTTTDQRKYFISKFQLDDSYVCAILSITAANAGITLTAAKLVLFAELHWNPSVSFFYINRSIYLYYNINNQQFYFNII